MRHRALWATFVVAGGLALVGPAALAETDDPVQSTLRGFVERLAPEGLNLADSTSEHELGGFVRVAVTRQHVYVDDEQLPLTLGTDAQGRPTIPDAEKRGQLVSRLYDALLERFEARRGLDVITSGASGLGEVLLVFDRGLPFSVVREVMYTAGQAQYGRLHLAVFHPWQDRLTTVPVGLPSIGPPPRQPEVDEEPPLNLAVLITDQGHRVLGADPILGVASTVACLGKGPCAGPADYDWARLADALRQVKEAHPGETEVIVVPESQVSVEVLVRTADTCRWAPALGTDAPEVEWESWCQDRTDLFSELIVAGGAR